MSDIEDPYAVSSDSEDEETLKKPPPKINIENRAISNIQDLKAAITEKKENTKDEARQEEIEELRKSKAAEMTKVKKEFEENKIHNATGVPVQEELSKDKPTGLNKDTLTAFKDKFEKFHQHEDETLDDHLKTIALEGVGKENLAQMKATFEKLQTGELTVAEVRDGQGLDFECSEADKRRILAAFIGPKSEEDIPKNCALCEKTVYPVERLFANKKLYHTDCFRCKTCNKKLSATQYNIYENVLYCKQHYNEVLHPDLTHAVADDSADQADAADDDDEFAIVSKPKQLSSDVVRAGTNIGDELQQIRSLKEKKQNLESSLKAQEQVKKPKEEILEISGNVKDRMSKIIAGGEKDVNDNDDEATREELEAIKAQVGDLKNKWKTGDVEKAEVKDGDAKSELEQLRKGEIKVRERFNERLQPAESENVTKSYDRTELDTSHAAEARKSFLDGQAYQTAKAEKTATDLDELKFTGLGTFKDKFEKGTGATESSERHSIDINVELGNIKKALEKGGVDEADMTPEERAERKKKEIEAEFLRYKLARKLQEKKAKEEAAQEEPAPAEEKTTPEIEIKMAGKAREKFRNIEAQNPNSIPLPKQAEKHKTSKWDDKKKDQATAEVVNRRNVEESESEEEDEDAFDVKNIMNKFKNIQNTETRVESAANEELEALRQQSNNFRKQFEQHSQLVENEQNEEKKKQLAEEFERLKSERSKLQEQLKAEEEAQSQRETEKEEIHVAADHASKMTAKWEKIHKKEAKKAGKSKMPEKQKS